MFLAGGVAAGIRAHDMDRMLHRGRHAKTGIDQNVPARGLAALKMSKEFKLDDKLLYLGSLLCIFVSFGIFLTLTSMFLFFGVKFSEAFWSTFWHYYSILMIGGGAVLTVWFAVGGMRDYRALMRSLATVERREEDDGAVVGGVNLIDLVEDVEKPDAG